MTPIHIVQDMKRLVIYWKVGVFLRRKSAAHGLGRAAGEGNTCRCVPKQWNDYDSRTKGSLDAGGIDQMKSLVAGANNRTTQCNRTRVMNMTSSCHAWGAESVVVLRRSRDLDVRRSRWVIYGLRQGSGRKWTCSMQISQPLASLWWVGRSIGRVGPSCIMATTLWRWSGKGNGLAIIGCIMLYTEYTERGQQHLYLYGGEKGATTLIRAEVTPWRIFLTGFYFFQPLVQNRDSFFFKIHVAGCITDWSYFSAYVLIFRSKSWKCIYRVI